MLEQQQIAIEMILGQYSPSLYFRISSIVLAATLIVIYWISQYYGHDEPFPKSQISSVANHYPEYIFFRTATISGSFLFVLGWITNYYYLQTIAVQKGINISKFKPQILLSIGILGSISLMGSTAFIDTASEHHKFHMKCAEFFFLLTIIAQLYNTLVFTVLSFKFEAVSRLLTYLKLTQAFLLLLQIMIDTKKSGITGDLQDDKGNFIEWTSSFTICLGYFIMSFDLTNFKYVYENQKVEDNRDFQLSMN